MKTLIFSNQVDIIYYKIFLAYFVIISKFKLSFRNMCQAKFMKEFGIDYNNPEAVRLFAKRFSRVYDGLDFEWQRRELKTYYV